MIIKSENRKNKKRKPTVGIEPTTFRLQGGCSTTKLWRLSCKLSFVTQIRMMSIDKVKYTNTTSKVMWIESKKKCAESKEKY